MLDEPKKKEENNNEVDDIIFESEENQGGVILIKKLRETLSQTLSEKQEYLAGWQRAKADLINAKKDFNEERNKLINFAKVDLIVQLIPLLDNFEMALESGAENKTDSLKEWLVGFQHIYAQFLSILRDNGVEQFSPLGEKFDPLRQESIEMIAVVDNEKDGVIIEVLQKGYTLNEKVIRPAKVKVGELKNKDLKI